MDKSALNRRLVMGGALALAGGATHAKALAGLIARPAPKVIVTEHGAGAWRSQAEFRAFRARYIDGGRVQFVVKGGQDTHLALARDGGPTTRHSDSASLLGAIETALTA